MQRIRTTKRWNRLLFFLGLLKGPVQTLIGAKTFMDCILFSRQRNKKRNFEKGGQNKWFHKRHIPDKEKQHAVKLSRTLYYRREKFLHLGILKNKRPHEVRQSKCSKGIRKLRLPNRIDEKQKITVLLRRDFEIHWIGSTVETILKKLKFPKFFSIPRIKRKRDFAKHTKSY